MLAWRLEQAAQPFQIIGSTTLPNAWSVAAGVINPVTGKWMTKSWNVDQLIPEAERIYRAIEAQLDIKIYHPMPLQRYCQNSADLKRSGRRMRNTRYGNVLGDLSEAGNGPEAIIDTYGSFEILQASYVDLPRLIRTLHQHFSDKGLLVDEVFNYSKLHAEDERWRYGAHRASRVIFCEGAAITHNPWFQHLPHKPAKGETLILSSNTLELPKSIYHHVKWLLPYDDQSFRVGATYDEADLSHEPTIAGKQALLAALGSFITPEHTFTVKEHLAGIRPGTADSRPLLGQHPVSRSLYILNGLGSKGASVAPEMSRQLLAYIFENQALDPEIDIARFLSK